MPVLPGFHQQRLADEVQKRTGGDRALEAAIAEWLRVVVVGSRAPGVLLEATETFDALIKAVEAHVLPLSEAARGTALARSREVARLQGARRALGYLARNRYDSDFRAKLAAILAGIESVEVLKQIGCLISDGESRQGLLRKIRRLWVPAFDAESPADIGVQ